MSKNLKTVLAIVVILLLGASVGFAVKNSNGGSKNAQVAGPRGETGSVGPSGLKGVLTGPKVLQVRRGRQGRREPLARKDQAVALLALTDHV
jgi:hypothetical protein